MYEFVCVCLCVYFDMYIYFLHLVHVTNQSPDLSKPLAHSAAFIWLRPQLLLSHHPDPLSAQRPQPPPSSTGSTSGSLN